ncbi:hypothetical protein PMX39_06360 [Enterocloster clostridioformis]|uniref:hypothetical protein n=1 Tax=Enterocloster clostridioformis TaxID=1531 RepID=UPI00232C211C|nr:hypothetical protein [Enterocloster clostridioformis]MDB2132256.1 hypothetical protein [Enterocloster clostridioformis]
MLYFLCAFCYNITESGTDTRGTQGGGKFQSLYLFLRLATVIRGSGNLSHIRQYETVLGAGTLGLHSHCVPDYYARRVLVLGSESTGKSTLVGSWRTLRPASLSLPLSIRQKNYYYDTTGKDEREGRKWRNRERAKETAVKNRA